MTAYSPPREHRVVLRYFWWIAAILSASAAILVFSGFVSESSRSRDRERLEAFHLRTMMLTREAADSLRRLHDRYSLYDAAGSGPLRSAAIGLDREIHVAHETLDRLLESVGALRDEFQGEHAIRVAANVTDRLLARHLRIDELLDGEETLASRVAEELDQMSFELYQLDRLHSIEVEGLLDRLAAAENRRVSTLVLGTALVVLLTGIAVARLFALVRQRLRESQKISEALLTSERQRLQSQKMEALGTLVGGIVHDLNNILTAILGNTELALLERGGDPEVGPTLREIRGATERATALSRKLLAFSRPEAANRQVLDLRALVVSLEPLLRSVLREDIELDVDLEEGLWVDADPVQLEQVVVNLVVNARDSMPDGGRLELRGTTRAAEPGDVDAGESAGPFARLSVRDTGEGMTPEVRARAFEPFFSTKPSDLGTGLGLSTVYGIVTQSGGHVHVDSEPGAGSTFEFCLPLVEAAVHAARPEPRVRPHSGPETLLLVEDDEQVRRLVCRALARCGYEVLVAGDSDQALAIAREHDGPIHLVVSDVVLPGIRGPALVTRIREIRPGARALFVSGYVEEELLGGVRDSGITLLQKPFQTEELLAAVREELDAVDDSLVARS